MLSSKCSSKSSLRRTSSDGSLSSVICPHWTRAAGSCPPLSICDCPSHLIKRIRQRFPILHVPIPLLQSRKWTSQPSIQLMQKQPRVLYSKKLLQQMLCVTITRFDIHHLQYQYNVCEQKLGAATRCGSVSWCALRVRMQEAEDAQFPPYPHLCSRLEVWRTGDDFWRQVAVLRYAVAAHIQRE